MNKIYTFLLGFITIIGLNSCDNTLDLFAEPKEIPVVYGLIDSGATEHYLRIERGFLDPEIPATELAQDANNLYFENIEASVTNIRTGEIYNISKVNAEDEGFEREEGFFATDPNYIYKFETDPNDLNENDELSFKIITSEETEPITGEIKMLSRTLLNTPVKELEFSFLPDKDFTLKWYTLSSAENPPVIWDISIYLNYLEADLSDEDPEFVNKRVKWTIVRNYLKENSTNTQQLMRDGTSFYQFLHDNLEVNPNLVRSFLDFDVEIISGDDIVQRYIEIRDANTGITSSQPPPTFTNLSRGLGLIASRNKNTFLKYFISPLTKNELETNELTADLNFD